MVHLNYNECSSSDWMVQNNSAVVASGCLLPSYNYQSRKRRITLRSNRSRKCSVRHRKRRDCYCTSRPVPTRINFNVNKGKQCCHSSDNCPFPDPDEVPDYMFEPIEKISLYNATMLQKARELLDYEPSTLFLRKLKAEACKAVLRESGDTRTDECSKCTRTDDCSKYTRARQAYEQYVNLRNTDESLVQPCACKFQGQSDGNNTDCDSKKNDANIQTLCVNVEKKCAATETNNRCCPRCCRCQKDKSTTADFCNTEVQAKQQEDKPKPQEVQPKPQKDLPKPQEEKPKPQKERPKPQQEKTKPQQEKPKPQKEKPKPVPPKEREKPKTPPPMQKPQTKPKKPTKSEKKTTEETKNCEYIYPLSPEIRDQERFKKHPPCEEEPIECPRQWCNCPQGSGNVKDLQLFRNDCFFETHSVSDFTKNTPKHDCIHLVNFNEKFQPQYVNTDPYGYSRCYICNRAMATVRNLAAKKPVMENVASYRKSKLSNLSMTKNEPVIIEPTKIQISSKSQKVMAKLPPHCEEAENFVKTKYRRPVPVNSFALRFQKGVYNK